MIKLSTIDKLISETDRGLRTLSQSHHGQRALNPDHTDTLSLKEKQHSAALMRINHCGEVCAQALYQGQALTAKQRHTQLNMQQAADEEIDHLVWCEQRLKELDGRTSYLNPLWYGLSFSMGALTGLLGDKVSLGFVAATEEEVCKHLEKHIEKLPENDHNSRVILAQMLEDERRHGEHALDAGGQTFPSVIKKLMSNVSKIMTKTSYWV